jgi:hypothetical protein
MRVAHPSVTLLSVVAAVGGVFLASISAKASLSPADMGQYSFVDDQGACQQGDLGSISDPITIAFIGESPYQQVVSNLNQIGWNVAVGGDHQRYYSYGNCGIELFSQASAAGGDRWHVRGVDGADANLGVFTVGTPHRDIQVSISDLFPIGHCDPLHPEAHYVPENYNGLGISGFVAAREEMVSSMVLQAGLQIVEYKNWYNALPIKQCNWQMPESDGLVAYVCQDDTHADTDGDSIWNACDPDDDNDHCVDVDEPLLVPPTNPLNQWDFYSVPTPALFAAPNPVGLQPDNHVSGVDAQAVFAYTKKNAHSGTLEYNQDLNLNGVNDGVEYDRTVAGGGLSGPPDGVVAATDAQLAYGQALRGFTC